MSSFVDYGLPAILLCILLISYGIALYAKSCFERDTKNASAEVKALEYFFGGNNLRRAIVSNLGSIFSICLIFGLAGATFNGRVGGLWSTLVPIALGLGLMASVFRNTQAMQNRPFQRYFFEQSGQSVSTSGRLSILHFVGHFYADDTGRSDGTTRAAALFYMFFAFLTVSLELAMVKVFLSEGVGASPATTNYIIFTIFVLCHVYVFKGGFRGVLSTDGFQLIFVGLSLIGITVFALRFGAFHDHGVSHFLDVLNDRVFAPERFRRSRVEIVFGLIVISAYVLSSFNLWTRVLRTHSWTRSGSCTRERELKRSRFVILFTMLGFLLVTAIVCLGTLVLHHDLPVIAARIPIGEVGASQMTTESFRFPLEVTNEIYAASPTDPVAGPFLESLRAAQWLGISQSAWLQGSLLLFFLIIAVTTIDTELIAIGQLHLLSRSSLGPARGVDSQSFFLLLSPLTLLFSQRVTADNYGDWGTYWIVQFFVVAPLLINSTIVSYRGCRWRVLRVPFYASFMASLILFGVLLVRPEIMRQFPETLVLTIFVLPVSGTLILHACVSGLRRVMFSSRGGGHNE